MDSTLISAMVADFGLDLLKMNDDFRRGTISPADFSQTTKSADVDFEYLRHVHAEASKTPEGRIYLYAAAQKKVDDIQAQLFANTPESMSFMNNVMTTLLARHGVNIKSINDVDKKEIATSLAQAAKLAFLVEKERIQGIRDESDMQHRIISTWEKNRPVPKDKGIPLRELFDKYLENWSVTDVARRLRKKAELRRIERSYIECFGELCGAKEVTVDDAKELQRYIQYEFHSHVMTNKTVNNYNETLSAVFNFGLKNKFVDEQPFKGLILEVGKDSERSRIFKPSELQTYVNYLIDLYVPETPETTWLPLIMMYSGMRCNEIAQLYLDDIQVRDGINYFRLVENKARNQKIKTESSVRDVPIHKTLIDFGFLKYVEKMKKAGHAQLFPNCVYRENIGLYYDSALSILLNVPINLIDNDRKLRLYSLRANFRCSVEEKFVNAAIAALDAGKASDNTGYNRYYDMALNDIMGHVITGSEGDLVYRKRQLHIADRVLQLAEYPSVDFTKLKTALLSSN